MVPRDDQRMAQMNGPDVKNGNRVAVLVQQFSRCRMMNDITKRAIRLEDLGAYSEAHRTYQKKL